MFVLWDRGAWEAADLRLLLDEPITSLFLGGIVGGLHLVVVMPLFNARDTATASRYQRTWSWQMPRKQHAQVLAAFWFLLGPFAYSLLLPGVIVSLVGDVSGSEWLGMALGAVATLVATYGATRTGLVGALTLYAVVLLLLRSPLGLLSVLSFACVQHWSVPDVLRSAVHLRHYKNHQRAEARGEVHARVQ